jgi:hypothetical protein
MAKKMTTKPSAKRICDILPDLLKEIKAVRGERPDLVLSAWPEIIGKRFASMTRAVSFERGILSVVVKNSTLLSLLTQHEKPRLIQKIKEQFPECALQNIIFRIG